MWKKKKTNNHRTRHKQSKTTNYHIEAAKRKKKCVCILILPGTCLMEEEIDFSASSKIGVESGSGTSLDFVEAKAFVRLAQMLYKNGQGKTS